MLPISGPIVELSADGSREKSWYRQKPPYDRPLPYRYVQGFAVGPGNSADGWRWKAFVRDLDYTKLYAQAYSSLADKLGEGADLGVSLVQYRQADAMIRSRANQLGAFTTSLVRRSPIGVAASLGISIRDVQRIMKTRHGVSRKLSDLWLEFWFGWKPLVSDIFTACEILNRELPWGKLKASRRDVEPYTIRQVPATESGEGIAWAVVRKQVSVGVRVRVKNPNVRLLQEFGVLNPYLVAWDVIPWSFVLGWFSNVDSYLSSFTDFAGLETSDGYVSKSAFIAGHTFWPYDPLQGGPGFGVATLRDLFTEVPRPRLVLKGFTLKPLRALTAMSLLVQKLPRS